jgi:hypothetical protein
MLSAFSGFSMSFLVDHEGTSTNFGGGVNIRGLKEKAGGRN